MGLEAIQGVIVYDYEWVYFATWAINGWDNDWINNGVMDIKHTSWWVYIMLITLSVYLLVALAIISCSRGGPNTMSCSHVSRLRLSCIWISGLQSSMHMKCWESRPNHRLHLWPARMYKCQVFGVRLRNCSLITPSYCWLHRRVYLDHILPLHQ